MSGSDEITIKTLADLAGTRLHAVCDACPHSAKLDVPSLNPLPIADAFITYLHRLDQGSVRVSIRFP